MNTHLEQIGFGGGCHWCTEAVFQALRGVVCVDQGFAKSAPPHDTWSEAVDITFDPGDIHLAILIDIHLRTHSNTSQHKLRAKYRSAIYVHDPVQHAAAQSVLDTLQPDFEEPFVTLVLSHRGFKPSADQFRNYYEADPDRPFCRTYIDPKLTMLRQRFAREMKA